MKQVKETCKAFVWRSSLSRHTNCRNPISSKSDEMDGKHCRFHTFAAISRGLQNERRNMVRVMDKQRLEQASVALRDALILIAHGCDKPEELAEDVLRSCRVFPKSKK